jgi:hypothetical protein
MLITGAGAVVAAGAGVASSSPVNCFVTNPPTPSAIVLANPIKMLFNEPPDSCSSAIL